MNFIKKFLKIFFYNFPVCNQAETPGSESECNLMDYGIFDIGMSQKHYSRSDAKVLSVFQIIIIVISNLIKNRK